MGPSLVRSVQAGGLMGLLTGCVVVLGGSSCNLGGIQGSGVPASQERTVGDFHRVVLLGSADADARVNAAEHLDARITGSGDIRYRGSPKTDVRVTGSGDVAAERR